MLASTLGITDATSFSSCGSVLKLYNSSAASGFGRTAFAHPYGCLRLFIAKFAGLGVITWQFPVHELVTRWPVLQRSVGANEIPSVRGARIPVNSAQVASMSQKPQG
jgi:hypothetical protein